MDKIEIETIMAVHLDVNGFNGEFAPMLSASCQTKADVHKIIGQLNAMCNREAEKRLRGCKASVDKGISLGDKVFLMGLKDDPLTPDKIKKMTPEQINKNWEKIKGLI